MLGQEPYSHLPNTPIHGLQCFGALVLQSRPVVVNSTTLGPDEAAKKPTRTLPSE